MSVGPSFRRGPVRPVLALALLAVVLLTGSLAGCATTSKGKPQATAGATAPGTNTVAFHPYTATGEPSAKVTDVVRGQCWTTSIAAPSADAFRCFQGNKILDPCFAPPHPTTPVQLACMASPWSQVLMVRVSGGLPKPAGPDAAPRPWALQLASGVRCVASTGTVPEVAGVALGYHCADGGDAGLVPNGGSTLSAQYAAPGASTVTTTTVATVWKP